ncbi:hypothetical protein [Metabacillus litoralis]|uniref:hypothetical protein n=1 Tax=Metabacillus litoralis TaxID=152268 RepID=UPI001CFEA752|nr:hypothetical protein [Metabacillus litoralis]
MQKKQLKELFNDYGYDRVFNNIEECLIQFGMIEKIDQESMEAFFYFFEMDEVMSGEQFVTLYCMFKTFYEKEKFPIIF